MALTKGQRRAALKRAVASVAANPAVKEALGGGTVTHADIAPAPRRRDVAEGELVRLTEAGLRKYGFEGDFVVVSIHPGGGSASPDGPCAKLVRPNGRGGALIVPVAFLAATTYDVTVKS